MPDKPPLSPFIRPGKNGEVILHIQVVPNAPKTLADGLHGETDEQGVRALKVRLHAPPVDGKANEALVRWLADELGVPRKSVAMLRGKTSRRKQVVVSAEAVKDAGWKALLDQAAD
ncbi:MAG: DUF167 domain-containing protein [Comamonadaceae bacterium]|nr:MAG: DUF167 domain-containing protein [Comamonadaceae bacterium]